MPTTSHYKLSYFDVRALAEPIRIILELLDIPYEDVRVTPEQWGEIKSKAPFGQLPILEIDGVEMAQSTSICRFLARKHGLAGKTPLEEFEADAIVDHYKDFIFFFRQFTSITFYGEDPEKIKKVADTIVRPAAQTYLAILNNILTKSTSGYLVGQDLTWADIVIADNLTSLLKNDFVDWKTFPILGKFYEKIHSIPRIAEYVKRRKDTKI